MEKTEYKGYTINIDYDEDPEDPREYDDVGIMVCFHKRYDLGDKTDLKSDQFESWQEVYDYLTKELKAICISPLYLYEHSGLRIKIGNFYGLLPQGHAEFDSGQVGFIYTTRKAILKNFGLKKLTQNAIRKAEKLLEGEVETYNTYISGQVLHFSIEDSDENIIDSCGGWYDFEDLIREAQSLIDRDIKEKQKKHETKLKTQIKHKTPLESRT